MVVFRLLMVMSSVALACSDGVIPCEDKPFEAYEWLDELRGGLMKAKNRATITEYRYKDECVYLVAPCDGCPDAMATVHNSAGETVCRFGGFAGFNTCPDFSDSAEEVRLLYEVN